MLYSVPDLVDDRVSFDGTLHLDFLCLDLDLAPQVRTARSTWENATFCPTAAIKPAHLS